LLPEKAAERGNVKMRTIRLTPKFLLEALQGKAQSYATNLPSDAQLLDLKFDLCSNQVFAVVRSDSFEDVAELYPIPELKLTYAEKVKTAVFQPTSTGKPEPKPTQPSQTTSKLEREFTPEQRKLLSFKVEGDHIVVKPTQFLKAEWDDINDIARSLGGKWVKGDIVSYWEIPIQ
jgi:hypothetical protein